jgi:hypothetical protein
MGNELGGGGYYCDHLYSSDCISCLKNTIIILKELNKTNVIENDVLVNEIHFYRIILKNMLYLRMVTPMNLFYLALDYTNKSYEYITEKLTCL